MKVNRDTVLAMGVAFCGEPLVTVASKSGIESDFLDFSFLGEPLFFLEDESISITVVLNPDILLLTDVDPLVDTTVSLGALINRTNYGKSMTEGAGGTGGTGGK